jgi:RHS repeat-associated protein
VISKTGSTRKVEYLLKDRLGSVDAVANATGTVIETRGYDAFGKPRDGSWNDLNPAKIASTAVTPKGFTQHEHLNQLELIHMNGRAFDYNLGRFTGVDPFIQFPLNSQSLNPYSYIRNNPLSGTDPTGYKSEQILRHGSICNTNACSGAVDFPQDNKEDKGSVSSTRGNRTKRGDASETGNGRSTMSVFGADSRGANEDKPEQKEAGVPVIEQINVSTKRSESFDGENWRSWYDITGRLGDWFRIARNLHMDSAYGSYAAGRGAIPRHHEKAGWTIVSMVSIGTPVPEVGAAGPFVSAAPVRPLVFSQTTASPFFSVEGTFAGRSIASVADDLFSGIINASDLPIEYIEREGVRLIVNTRSSLALRIAGVPQSQWRLVNRTGVESAEAAMTERLTRNGLTNAGTETLRITGRGKHQSVIVP